LRNIFFRGRIDQINYNLTQEVQNWLTIFLDLDPVLIYPGGVSETRPGVFDQGSANRCVLNIYSF